MGVLRNFIEVIGLALEEELPDKSYGQLIKYSEVDHIGIPKDKSGIKDVYQIAVKVEIKSIRVINTVDNKTVVLDGVKLIKLMCTQHESPDKVVMINLQLPYNTFFEMSKQIENVEKVNIHIIDAYFEILEKRRLYGHFVYLVDVRYSSKTIGQSEKVYEAKPCYIAVEPRENEIQIALSHENFSYWNEDLIQKVDSTLYSDEMETEEDIDCEYL